MQTLKIYTPLIFFIIVFYSAPAYSQIENLDFSADTEIENTGSTVTKNQSEEIKTDASDLVHSGDLIDVDILGSTEFDWRGKVTPEGFISGLKFVEIISAQCRTETELADEIAKLYTKFLRNPKVQVRILDRTGRPVSLLLGAIKIPQRFLLKRPIYLNELIILSGGLTDQANGDIQILRRD
jgi:protein involved in polysaccharide export with SLBB domain